MAQRSPGQVTPVRSNPIELACMEAFNLGMGLEMAESAFKRAYISLVLTERRGNQCKAAEDARGCTALTELKADAAKYVDARGCTALTELKADTAEYVDASGCNSKLRIKAKGATIYR